MMLNEFGEETTGIATDKELASMPGTGGTRMFDVTEVQRIHDENEEAFAGMPTEDLRKRLEYSNLEATARMMVSKPDSYGDEEIGAIFKELNKRRFIADDKTLAAFDVMDADGKVTNLSRLQDFLAFSDRLAATKDMKGQQDALFDKFASPELKAWREAERLDAPNGIAEGGKVDTLKGVDPEGNPVSRENRAKIARDYFAKNGRSYGDLASNAIGWLRGKEGWDSDQSVIDEYERTLQNDVLRAEAAKVMPYLSDAQRNLVNVYAAGGEVSQGVFKLMSPQDREMMYSMCQAVRPTWDGNWFADMIVRAGTGVRGAVRSFNRADIAMTDISLNKAGEFLFGKKDMWSTPEEREALRKDLIDDIHWAEAVHDIKMKDPEGFVEKALAGYADSFSMQSSMLGGEILKRMGTGLKGTWGGVAASSAGYALQGYTALSMIGEQFENMLLRGVPLENAAPMAIGGGLVDTYVESMNLKTWFGRDLTTDQMKRVGIRAAFRTAFRHEGRFIDTLRANARQAILITESELKEEIIQGANKEGWCSVAEGRNIMDAFSRSDVYVEGMKSFFEALPSCTAFGVFGAANVGGLISKKLSISENANGAYAERLTRISDEVAKREGLTRLGEVGDVFAMRIVQNRAASIVKATEGMDKKQRNEWINSQEDLSLAEKEFYSEHCDFYAATEAVEGKAWRNAHLSGSINEAMFAKAGWKFGHDESGNIVSVETADGTIPIDFRNREARIEDFNEKSIAEFIDEHNRMYPKAKLSTDNMEEVAKAISKEVNGWYRDGTIVLFGAKATGATLAHESTHAMIKRLSDLGTKEAQESVRALVNLVGGKGLSISSEGEESLAYGNEERALAAETAAKMTPADGISVKAIAKNLVTAVKKAVGRGKGQEFVPVYRTAEGVEYDPSEFLHDEIAKAMAAYQRKIDLEAAQANERKEAAKKFKEEREAKRQKKIEMRKAEAAKRAEELKAKEDALKAEAEAALKAKREELAKAAMEVAERNRVEAEFKKMWDERLSIVADQRRAAEAVANYEQWKNDEAHKEEVRAAQDKQMQEVLAEIAAEEQAALDAIDAKYEAEYKLLAEEEAKDEAIRKAEEERQAKMEAKMLANRKNATKEPPRLGHAKNQDGETAQRCRAAYLAAWKAKSGKSLSQADIDQLAEVYGLPPEAVNLKKTGNGYRIADGQMLTDEALAKFADGLIRLYADLKSVKIIVPDVVVASAEEAANAVPNEVWDPVSDTFVTGRIVVDAANAKSLREQAGMEEPSVSPAEIEEKREGAGMKFSISPAEDAAYADAVKRGDRETALKMIREAVAKAERAPEGQKPNWGSDNASYHNGENYSTISGGKSTGYLLDKDGLPKVIPIRRDGFNQITNPWYVRSMPDELAIEISSWDKISKSPYSDSFYDTTDISWDNKPDGSIRVADHWNFMSRGRMHCVTDVPVENITKWTMAKYNANDDKYHVIKQFDAIGDLVDNEWERYPKMYAPEKPQAKRIANGITQSIEVRDAMIADNLIGKTIDYRGFSGVVVKGKNSAGDYLLLRKDGKTLTAKARNLAEEGSPAEVFVNFKTGSVKSADITYDDAGNLIPLSERFEQGNPDIRFSITNAEWDKLENHFGVTVNGLESGYIIPNGHMLDFSGAHWTANRKAPNPGHRQVDHADVKEVIPRGFDSNWLYRWEMMEAGAIRVMPEMPSLGIARDITPEQEDAIYDWLEWMRGKAYGPTIEFFTNINGETETIDFPAKVSARAVINAIHAHYEENGTDRTKFSIRREEPPKKTGIGYKVFVMKDGKLYPPMVANPDGTDTPVGVWLNADEGNRAPDSKTGRQKVKAGGKGTNGGGGSLSWRPGWHLGTIPYALQFNVGEKVPNPLGIKNKAGKVIEVGKYFPANFVWAEVEYAADNDYQEEAESYGYNESGNFQHSLAGMPRIPVDGSYRYRTNPNPATDPWIITGAMRVKKILTNAEVDELVRNAGREPQLRENPETNEPHGIVDAMPEGYAGADKQGRTKFSIATYTNGGRDTLVKWMFGDVGKDLLTMSDKDLMAYIKLADEYKWMKGSGKTAFRKKLHPGFVPVDSKSAVGKGDLTIADAISIVRETDKVCETAKELAKTKEFKHFSNWSEVVVETDNEGHPIFGVVRPNGDYAYNLDFSTICKKRRPLDHIFASLVDDGTITDANINILLSEENIPKIQDIIKAHGLEVACALCFVDSKRYKIGEVAKNFSTMWNGIQDMYAENGKAWKSALALAHKKRDGKHFEADEKTGEMKEAKPTFYDRAVMLVDEDANARTKVDASWLISGEGMDDFARKYTAIHNLYRSFGGVSKAKDAHADVAWNNDIIRPFAHYTNPKSSMSTLTREKAYAVGGVRLQSFTDFIPALFFDYAQMTAELAAKHLPLHTYTKEVDFVKLFGLTGMKMNMSLVPGGTGVLWKTEAEGKKLGLVAIHGKDNKPVKKDGKVAFYDLVDECFPIKDAFELRKGSSNVGTIMVGVSDEHILMMLDDPRIDMVIPYHKSSLNGMVAAMRKIDKYDDYTDYQSTKKPDGAKDFDFYGDLAKTKDPRKTAENYLAYCKANGFTAKFTNSRLGTDFSKHRNYYKILADFRLYKDDGKTYAPQGDVTQTYPKNLATLLRDAMEHDQRDMDALDRETEPIKEEVRAAVFKMGDEFRKAKGIGKKTKPSDATRKFSIGDRSAENVAKFYLAREIMENKGRVPDTERAKAVARSLGYAGSIAGLIGKAQEEAATQTQLLRYLASDPKTERVLARAGLALRNERAIERARSAAIQFSREVSEAGDMTRKATDRAVRMVRGEDYEQMLAREGIDLNAILLAIRPAERAEPTESGEKMEQANPVILDEAARNAVAEEAKKVIAEGAKRIEEAKAMIAAKAKDDAVSDGKGNGKGKDKDKTTGGDSEDIAYGNAVSAALHKAFAEAGFTLDSPEQMVQLVKAITEKYIRDYPAEFTDLDPNDVWSSPLARAKFAANLASFANAVAAEYSPSYARVRISGKAQLLNDKGLTTMRKIEQVGEDLFRDLHSDIIRQSRESLIAEIKKALKPHALGYKENELMQERKGVDPALGRYCKFAYRVIKMSANEVEARAQELEDELSTWRGISEDEAERYREFADKKMELEMLDMFGNLKDRMPSELRDIRDFVEQTVNESRWETMQFGEKWEQSRSAAAEAMMLGIEGNPKRNGVQPEDDEVSGLYSLIGMMETKAHQLTRFCRDGAKRDGSLKSFATVEEMIQRAEDIQYNFMQIQKAKFTDICKSVYGSEAAAADALTADIDESLWSSLDKGDQKTAWTIGRVMQMYVSCVQADYADNCAKYGRDAEYVRLLEDIINRHNPKHMDFIRELRSLYMENGDALSEVLQRTTGTRLLTPNRLYMPVKMLRDKNIAQKGRARAYNPFAPSLAPRVKNGLDFDQTMDIIDMWKDRLDDTAHTIGWADTGSMVQGICLSDRVMNSIRKAHGDKVMRQWNNYMLDILAGAEQGRVDGSNWGLQAVKFCARLASRTWLMLNPASWSKQLAAVPCFALSADGNLKDVSKSLAFITLHPRKAAEVMRDLADTSAFKARYGVAISQEMKYATSDEGRFNTWIGKIIDKGMAGTMKFDEFAVYMLAGVYQNKRSEMETQGKTAKEASELASSWLMHIVDKTAQTTRAINTTEIQRAGGAWSFLLQFKSAPAQQTQFEIAAIQDALGNPNDAKRWKKAAVCILINHLIVPTINTTIESLLTCLTSWGIPDEEKRQRLIELWIANCISGSLGSIFFLGTIAEAVGSLVGKIASGGEVNTFDLGNSVGRQIPATDMLNLWIRQGDKAIKALCAITDGDIKDGAYDLAKAVLAVTPGASWMSRKGFQAYESAADK